MAISLGPIGQIVHFAGISRGQPLLKSLKSNRRRRRASPGQLEAKPPSLLLQLGRQGLSIDGCGHANPNVKSRCVRQRAVEI